MGVTVEVECESQQNPEKKHSSYWKVPEDGEDAPEGDYSGSLLKEFLMIKVLMEKTWM